MRTIARHDDWQQTERMKSLRIIFGCPGGARKWRILCFLLHSKNSGCPLHGQSEFFSSGHSGLAAAGGPSRLWLTFWMQWK